MLGESVAQVSAQQTSPELSWKVPIRPLTQARLVSKLPLAWLKNYYLCEQWHNKTKKKLTWSKKLASSCSNSCPQICRQLLRVLMMKNKLRDRSLAQRPRSSHGPRSSFLLQKLAVNQCDQLFLHWP
jgi:hypothetical protein